MKTEINGQEMVWQDVGPEETAVASLRQRCGLTGTKLVCGSGVCGACTIRVNGAPVLGCLTPTHHLEGQKVETVEKHTAQNLHPVQRAFMAHDGLQCGYCTPGFIVESIAFYERWRAQHGSAKPSREQVAEALAGHLCRCGAYVGIYAAVQAACAGEFEEAGVVSAQRVDALEKVTGTAQYTTDIRLEGQLVGKIFRSSHAHAAIRRLNLMKAESVPGVTAVWLFPAPNNKVRYVGQPLAAVAAINEDAAAAALAAIEIEYDALLHAIGIEAGMATNMPEIWAGARKFAPTASEGLTQPGTWQGNARRAMLNVGGLNPKRAHKVIAQTAQEGGFVVEQAYTNGLQIHTALEPHCAVAHWPSEGKVEAYLSTQAIVGSRHAIAEKFKLPPENVTVIAQYIGGGFGAKNTLSDEAIAAIELSRLAKAPVAVIASRAEEMGVGGMRPGGRYELKLAANQAGELTGLTSHAYTNGGVSVGSLTALFTGQSYSGGARDILDIDVVSNHAPGKPFRGPGGPGAAWAIEQAVDQLAHQMGKDSVALRRSWSSEAKRLKLYDWVDGLEVWQKRPATGSQNGRYRRGVGVAFGQWSYIYDPKTVIQINSAPNGLTVTTATQDIGNGVRTALTRIVADVFGLPVGQIHLAIGHSAYPPGPAAAGSRTTPSIYEPTERAALLLRDQLFGLAAEALDLETAVIVPGGIQHKGGLCPWSTVFAKVPPQEIQAKRGTDSQRTQQIGRFVFEWMGMEFMIGQGSSQAAAVAEVEVDTLLGKVRIQRIWENLAVGKVHFPDMARSQVYGGIIQAIGYALYEEKIFDLPTGQNLTTNLQDYRIPGIGDIPEMEVLFTDGGFEHIKGQGAGISELCTVPVGAAIANAIFNATGVRCPESPIKPERLITQLQERAS